jgi:hypothetical protein
MAIPELTRANLSYFVQRLNAIESEQQRHWGRLSPAALMCHLRYSVESSLEGGPQVQDRSIPVVRTLLKSLFFEWFTRWPKGIKAPDELTPAPQFDLNEERRLLIAVLERFVSESERNPDRKAVNVLLGSQPLRYFARIHGVHFHHHFRQYGVV